MPQGLRSQVTNDLRRTSLNHKYLRPRRTRLTTSFTPLAVRSQVTKYICSSPTPNLLSTFDPVSRFASSQRSDSRKSRKCRRALTKKKRQKHTLLSFLFAFASPLGFEPRSLVLETRILPLNYRPKNIPGEYFC